MSTHTKFSEFDVAEQDGQKVVTARPASSADEPVRFDGSIAESGSRDQLEANWEDIIASLAQRHLGGQLTIDDARGVIDRSQAVKALVDGDAERARNEHAAHAVIEYLASKDVLELEDDKVVVLMSSENLENENAFAMLNNWAATLDACVERIQAAIDRVEQNRETLESHLDELDDMTTEQDYAQEKEEIEQEIQAMLAGRQPSELDEDEYKRFQNLRERHARYESLEESVMDGPEMGNGPGGTEQLQNLKTDLEYLKGALQRHSVEFRKYAASKDLTDANAREMVKNFTQVAADIGGATDPAEKMKETSDEEFMEQIRETSEATKDVERAEEATEDATTPVTDQ